METNGMENTKKKSGNNKLAKNQRPSHRRQPAKFECGKYARVGCQVGHFSCCVGVTVRFGATTVAMQ